MIDSKTLAQISNVQTTLNRETSQQANKRFGEDIKGVNEFIGALQSVQIVLVKILKIAQGCLYDATDLQQAQISESELTSKKSLATSEIASLVAEAQFLGTPLFDTNLSANVNGTQQSICFTSPLSLAPDFHALSAYVQEKQEESMQLLLLLSEALSTPSNARFENVDTNALAFMLKG